MLTRESVNQLLYLLRLFREGFEGGLSLRRAYRQAVRQTADRYGVTYQTLGDLCRRRLNLKRIGAFYALLEDWMGGEPKVLADCLKAASSASAHGDIDVFFEAAPASGAQRSRPARGRPGVEEPEAISFRLPAREARMLRALAELEGMRPPDLLRRLVGGVVKDKMKRVVTEIDREGRLEEALTAPARRRRGSEDLVSILREHRDELQRLGVEHLALFGSAARGEAGPSSDVDVAVTVAPDFSAGGLAYLARVGAVRERLAQILAAPVDVIEEPVENPRLQRQIDEDRIVAF